MDGRNWPSLIGGGNFWTAQIALARAIALLAHQGQTDKSGADYIEHPARVALRFDPNTEPLRHCAAWLHDVVEDCGLTERQLHTAGVSDEVIDLVSLLTRRNADNDAKSLRWGPFYDHAQHPEHYYLFIRSHPDALAVKLADIADNTAEWRVAKLDASDRARLQVKYARAAELLTGDDAIWGEEATTVARPGAKRWYWMGKRWPNTDERFAQYVRAQTDPESPFSNSEMEATEAYLEWQRRRKEAGDEPQGQV